MRTSRRTIENEPEPEQAEDGGKDELINQLKTQVTDLKTERSRLLEHIDALTALKKEHEGKIRKLEVAIITSNTHKKRRRKVNRNRGDISSRTVHDLCVFLQGKYSRVSENMTNQFSASLETNNYSARILRILRMIFGRMNRLARLFGTETNFYGLIDGSGLLNCTQTDVNDKQFTILYDYNLIGQEVSCDVVDLDHIDEHIILVWWSKRR